MQYEVRALERPGIGRPVMGIDQESKQRKRASRGIGRAGGDVAPERGKRIHGTCFAQGRQVSVVVEQEAA